MHVPVNTTICNRYSQQSNKYKACYKGNELAKYIPGSGMHLINGGSLSFTIDHDDHDGNKLSGPKKLLKTSYR